MRDTPYTSFIVSAAGLGFYFAGWGQQAIDVLRAGIAANPGFYILYQFLGEAYAV